MRKLAIMSVLMLAPWAQAQDYGWVCEYQGQKRHVYVAYPQAGAKLPCEVRYYKAHSMEVLWQAANTRGYCEKQAEAFAHKQEGWGWSCREVVYVDDTDDSAERELAGTADQGKASGG
jgi:hypothetical protein